MESSFVVTEYAYIILDKCLVAYMALVKYRPIFKNGRHRKFISANVDRGAVTGPC